MLYFCYFSQSFCKKITFSWLALLKIPCVNYLTKHVMDQSARLAQGFYLLLRHPANEVSHLMTLAQRGPASTLLASFPLNSLNTYRNGKLASDSFVDPVIFRFFVKTFRPPLYLFRGFWFSRKWMCELGSLALAHLEHARKKMLYWSLYLKQAISET